MNVITIFLPIMFLVMTILLDGFKGPFFFFENRGSSLHIKIFLYEYLDVDMFLIEN